MNPRNLEVSIEELVLYGFAPGDRYRIGEGLERELTRLFIEQGVPSLLAESHRTTSLDGGTFELTLGAKGETVGVQVAQELYGGFSG